MKQNTNKSGNIHPLAAVDPRAGLAADVEVGPFAVIGAQVEVGAGTRIHSHAVIDGPTRIGRDNVIHPYASIGAVPQDKKFQDSDPSRCEIGDRNTIREYVTINRGTKGGGGVTRVGNDNWIMAYVHLAHDCLIGDDNIFANAATLAGHVTIEDHVVLGGFTMVHQFCRIGSHAFTAMAAAIGRDVPPFMTAAGHMAVPRGINSEGLRRRGYERSRIARIKSAYRILYRSGLTLEDAMEQLRDEARDDEDVARLVRFIEASERSIIR